LIEISLEKRIKFILQKWGSAKVFILQFLINPNEGFLDKE